MEIKRLEEACGRVLERLQRSLVGGGESIQGLNLDAGTELDLALADENESCRERLREEIGGWGPLKILMQSDEITEIIVNGRHSIWLERHGALEKHDDLFLSEVTLNNFRHRLCHEAQVSTDLNVPCTDGQWRDFRVHIISPPLSERLQITLRRQPRLAWTFDRLREKNWASREQFNALQNWIEERRNFLIVGPTGSGKTSVLNACLQCLPDEERAICLEDTSELFPRPGASCKLLTRTDVHEILKDFQLSDLVRQSLRMRPTRLIVGEVRGAEAKDLLLALATGHRGSLGTLHASDAKQALLRLEMLVQLGAGQWNHEAIRQLIYLSLDGILVAGFHKGKRALEGLYRIASLESFGFLLERVA